MNKNPITQTSPSDLPEEQEAAAAPLLPRKLGANHSETADKPRKHHKNFKQSRDIREDRSTRQMKSQAPRPTNRG